MQKNGPAANNREIERKFLLKRLPESLKSRCYIIDQGYLASEPAGRQVRLRKKGSIGSLTFKVGRGSHREEREIRLSPKQFDSLWPGTAGRRLRKVRCEIPWKNLLIEIDIYQGRHAGLVVAEVEFPDRVSLPKIQTAFLVWTGSDWGKTLQQRATRQRVSRKAYGIPFEVT